MNLTYKIKTALLHFLRYSKQSYVATEVWIAHWIADVLYIPKKKQEVREIEVKVSKADLLNDFIKKEHKHKQLLTDQFTLKPINYFYFCVPEELKEFALEQLKDKPYGLYIFKEIWKKKNSLQEQLDLTECIECVKNPKQLLNSTPKNFEQIKTDICMRAMSDLATLYKLYYYNGDKKTRNIIREKS
jgi:hypothetical protein